MDHCYILLVPKEIINLIINNYSLPLNTKIRFMSTCSIYYSSIKILFLQSRNITSEILVQSKFQYVFNLNISRNSNISCVPYLPYLTKLDICHNSNMTCIPYLPYLTKLKIYNAMNTVCVSNLTSLNIVGISIGVNCLTNLKKLNLNKNYNNICQNSISSLVNLTYLNISGNTYIKIYLI